MAALQLQYWPAEVLRKVAEPVTEFNSELVQTLEDMAETMYVEQGIGLAAPQVGISKRMIVIDVPTPEEGESRLRALINPVITQESDTIIWEEGCLSFPSITADVTRARNIVVSYKTPSGDDAELEATELEAVCIQHEIDHLNGVSFVDYLSPLKRKLLLRELDKYLTTNELVAK